MLGHLDVERLSAFVVDLQHRVVDREVVVQERLEVATGGVAVVVGADEQVRG